jgi:hypothetical protein
MTKNLIIAALVLLLITSICNNVVTHYGALKLIDEVQLKLKQDRDEHRRWVREFTDEYSAKVKDQEHRLERFREILRRHRIRWTEEPGAVLEIAPPKIGADITG